MILSTSIWCNEYLSIRTKKQINLSRTNEKITKFWIALWWQRSSGTRKTEGMCLDGNQDKQVIKTILVTPKSNLLTRLYIYTYFFFPWDENASTLLKFLTEKFNHKIVRKFLLVDILKIIINNKMGCMCYSWVPGWGPWREAKHNVTLFIYLTFNWS